MTLGEERRDSNALSHRCGFLLFGVVAIVLPWVALKRTGRDFYRVLGILDSIVCGWCCFWIIASWFVAVMPSYVFLANPLLFTVALASWFLGGANASKQKKA